MTDLLTEEEREIVETARSRAVGLSFPLAKTCLAIIDRLAPKPPPKTDRELLDTIDSALKDTYAYGDTLREVRDVLRARGAK